MQAFLIQRDNVLAAAVAAATHTRAASDTVERAAPVRVGASTGLVRLTGPYTGADDATFEVRIASGSSTNRRVSTPVFAGVGSGTMEDVSAANTVAPQAFTVTLADLGTDDHLAELEFFGVTLRSRGFGGAAIAVNTSGITHTATDWSLLEDVSAGSERFADPAYNFGALPLLPGGLLDPATPRVSFGGYGQIYRTWYKIEQGERVYYFDPPIARDLAAGTRVYTVTGSYTVTVTRGVSVDSFAGIVTLYDFLRQIKADKCRFITVDGVVVEDRTPGGMAVDEFPFRTDASLRDLAFEGSDYLTELASLTIDPVAPTEKVKIVCSDNTIVGAEKWAVTGSVSGELADATTGVAYSDGPLAFTIPVKTRPVPPTVRRPYISSYNLQSREEGVPLPDICLYRPLVGGAKPPDSITLRWTPRPADARDCKKMPIASGPSAACLGLPSLPDEAEGDNVDDIPTAIQPLIQSLTAWKAAKIAASAALAERGSPVLYVEDLTNPQEVRLYDAFFDLFKAAALDLAAISGAVTDLETLEAALEADTDLAKIEGTDAEHNLLAVGSYIEKYRAAIADIYADAGKFPPKTDASGPGSDCWQDHPESNYYWQIVGTDYLPVFNVDHDYYHSSRLEIDPVTGEEVVVDTHQFGFGVRVDAVGDLKQDDEFTITFPDANSLKTYEVDDTATVSILAGQPGDLQGEVVGNNTHTWTVRGASAGVLADYAVVHGAETAYSASGLGFTIKRGGVPNALGDSWTFEVSGDQFEWRKDGGAWSAAADITSPVALSDGLSAVFVAGPGKAFEAGDLFAFTVRQPFAARLSRTPDYDGWEPGNAAPSITLTLAAAQSIGVVAIGRHTIAEGVTITGEIRNASNTVVWTDTLAWSEDVIFAILPDSVSGKIVKITFSGLNTDARVQWVWAGEALAVTDPAEECVIKRVRRLERSRTGNPGLYRGRGWAINLAWRAVNRSRGWLRQADVEALLAAYDSVTTRGDEPMVVIPNQARQQGFLVTWGGEEWEPDDISDYISLDDSRRIYSAAIQFDPVLQ